MEWVETTGRSIEEAKDRALDELGVDEADAEFEVIAEPKAGLFGRVRGEARVRARVRPSTPRAKETGRKRRERPKAGSSSAGGSSGGSSASSSAAATERPAKAEKPDKAGSGGGERRPRKQSAPRKQKSTEESGETMTEPVSLAEQGSTAKEFLEGLLGALDRKGTVTLDELDEDTIEVVVEGDDLGLLIGPRGSTLTALQDVARTVVQRRTAAHEGRLMVDVGGYRKKRAEALSKFTTQLAQDVKESGSAKALEPMPPADRKVIHDTINAIDGVVTTSEGEEPRRYVVIRPA